MYHIKDDKRCQTSARLIADALDSLLQKKSFSDITVSDIQKTAGIGRSTFYRHFDTIDDVVAYKMDERFRELAGGFAEMPLRDFSRMCLQMVIENGDVLMNVISSGSAELLTHSLRESLGKSHGSDDPGHTSDAHFSFAVFAAACISIIKTWDENGRKESIDELTEYLEKYLDFSEITSAFVK